MNERPHDATAGRSRIGSRVAALINAAAFLAALAVFLVAANLISLHPRLRWQVDATRTRAYSLSSQTRQLLQGLQGAWTVAIIMDESDVDLAARRQLDEVLRRMAQAAPGLRLVRVDPRNPQSMTAYEDILASLYAAYREPVATYDRALNDGAAALDDARLLVLQQGPGLRVLLDRLSAAGRASTDLAQRVNAVGLLADHVEPMLSQLRQARQVSQAQPIADYEGARSMLAQSLTEAAAELQDLSSQLERVNVDPAEHSGLRQAALQMRQELRSMALRLAGSGDALRQLPPLELGPIGRRLAEGEAAIVLGPTRAAVVPSAQLLPKSNLRQTSEGGVRFDQRFRGEQVLAAAVRSLLVPHMPLVVFVHAEDGSMLRRRDRQIDLLGVATMLSTAGYEVREWEIGASQRPQARAGQPVVWVIVPPTARTQLEPDERERRLLEAAQSLLDEGRPLLLSLHPSLLPKLRQRDPWAALVEPLGLNADTGQVIVQRVRVSAEAASVERNQVVQDFSDDHVVGRTVDGQQALLSLPVSMAMTESSPAGLERHIVAQVQPHADRWLEPEWHVDEGARGQAPPRSGLDQPLPVVVAVSRPHPVDRGPNLEQRVMVMGSGGWMLSFVADVTVPLGGQRVALAYPGNHELLLASVAWLAGLDEFIAPSPTSRQTSRLGDMTPAVLMRWKVFLLAIMPTTCLVAGAVVWHVRRR